MPTVIPFDPTRHPRRRQPHRTDSPALTAAIDGLRELETAWPQLFRAKCKQIAGHLARLQEFHDGTAKTRRGDA